MRFHWYWPFARTEELEWARATVRPGEQIVAQVIDRPEAPPASDSGALRVLRDLPEVDRQARGLSWVLSRSRTYVARAAVRRDLWQTEGFDLVHLHYVNRFTDGFARLPRPLVMSVHDVVPHVARLGRRLETPMLERLYKLPDALVVHHASLAARLCDEFGVDPGRVHVVPHQVFPVPGPEVEPADGPPMVLFFGSLRPNKGLKVLDGALQHMASMDLTITIAGRGDRAVEDLARRMAARDSRVMAEIGFASLDRKRELFREATLVVLPYTSFASQSGVLQDAYGHGRPAVVTDVGALGDTVREDGTGFVVPPSDPAALSKAILRALDPVAWRALAHATRRVAAERAPSVVGSRLRAVYDVVL